MEKLCIFDLDGTVLNTLDSIAYFVNEALKEYGIEPVKADTIRTFVGSGARNLIMKSLNFRNSDLDVSEVLKTYMEKYNKDATYLVTPYDGMMELLDTLKANGVKIAVLSNKPHSSTTIILDKVFGEGYFYEVRGSKDDEPKKPDPTTTNEIAKGFSKKNCFFIGDSGIDIKTGQNAEMVTIGVSWGFRGADVLKEAGADHIVDTPREMLDIIL
ncbi:MAG: HAD family hydrolase [Clostridia bacterium]|nr:HAD family hydrolase [Clostridia bacterium]